MLPKNEWVKEKTEDVKRNVWIYGQPFSGKTTFAASAPDVIFLSTDGNYRNLKSGIPPHIDIRDTKVKLGLMTKETPAWEIFRNAVDDLAADDGKTYKTVCVDVLEDAYEHCRKYQLDRLGIKHEADKTLMAYDFVRTEFLNVMRKLCGLPYNVILISHQRTEKDITKRDGNTIKAIEPNIAEKIALKISGMVSGVFRTEDYRLVYKGANHIFGGTRFDIKSGESLPLDWKSITNLKEEGE